MSRNAEEGFKLYVELLEKDIQKAETKEKIRVAFEQAEKEVTDLHKRISQGIQTTKEKNQLLPQ